MIIQNLSNADYHAHAAISKTQLDKFHRSPAHYQYHIKNGNEPTEAMLFGSALHALVLEPGVFADEYILGISVDRRTKAGKAEWAEFSAAADGKQIIKPDDWETLHNMRDAVMSHPSASILLSGGTAEQSAFWADEETGIDCRCRPDYHKGSILVDLKSTKDASPREFGRSAGNLRYHVQGAYYLDGFNAAGGNVDEFVFIAVEKTPPYAVAVYVMEPEHIEKGRASYMQDLRGIKQCRNDGVWPAYDNQPMALELPGWVE